MKVEIVPLAPDHLESLAEIERLCFPEPWSREALAEEIENPSACFFTAVCEGRAVGYIGAHFACGEFYVDNLAMHPAYRRRGIGRALLAALIDFARRCAGEFITLEVRPSNAPARALYAQRGFREVGRRKNFYSHPAEDALLLRLDIHSTRQKGDAPC